MAGKPRTLARVVHLYSGLDLIGSKPSISSRDAELQIYDWGVKAISKKTKRIVRIYAANIKGLEEMPGSSDSSEE